METLIKNSINLLAGKEQYFIVFIVFIAFYPLFVVFKYLRNRLMIEGKITIRISKVKK